MFDQSDFLEKNLDRQIGFVRASESRARFLLPALSLSLAIWLVGFQKADSSSALVVLVGVLSLVGFVLAYYHLWYCFYPKTDGPRHSLIFFGGIASRSLESYANEVEKLDEKSYHADLIEQIHINAEIAKQKFRSVQLAMMFWYTSLVPLVFFAVLSLKEIQNGP